MAMDTAALNAALNARGIMGFGQQPATPAASAPTRKPGLLDALRMMAFTKMAQQRGVAAPTMDQVLMTPVGKNPWSAGGILAPPPAAPPVTAPPITPAPQTPRASPQPFASQFDWSKFINTGDG